jgi:hypothetical protein
MINARFETGKFRSDLRNIMQYASGYVDGVKAGKQDFLYQIGFKTEEYLSQFIDSMAKVNPAALHHMYEWYETGNADQRLFEIEYTVSNLGLSFKPNYLNSTSQAKQREPGKISDPFWDKARVMEEGVPVRIKPKRSTVLFFIDSETGEEVYTQGPINVDWKNRETSGSFEKTFNVFFAKYFTQSFLDQSGVRKYLENPVIFPKNMKKGALRGRPEGYSTGLRFIFNAGLGQGR